MVFGKLVSGSEKNEQMQQVTDIRNAVLGQELQLPIKEEPDAFCMYALAYEGETPVATGGISFDGASYQMKEVAVLPKFRRKKYGDDRQSDDVRSTDDQCGCVAGSGTAF